MLYLLAFVAIIALIVIHEAGHFLVARWCGMRVERFSIFFGPTIAQFTHKGTIFQIGCIPLGGYVQITGMNPLEQLDASDPNIYPNRPAWQRVATIFAGPAANYLAASAIMFGLFAVVGVMRPKPQQEVRQVVASSPAAAAGILAGDELVAIEGEKVTPEHPAVEIVERMKGAPVKVELLREGKPVFVEVTPEATSDGRYRMGVQLVQAVDYKKEGIFAAIVESLRFPVEDSAHILTSLYTMIEKKQSPELSGPIGIVSQLGSQMKRGLRDSIWLIAHLSVFLGLFNLLPIPALDGGRLVFLFYEGIFRRKVNQRVEAGIHLVGFVLLVGIMLFASVKDVKRVYAPTPPATEPTPPTQKAVPPSPAPETAPPGVAPTPAPVAPAP